MIKSSVTRGDINQIFAKLNEDKRVKIDTLYYIALLYDSGLRVSEAINYDGGGTICGKGGHERRIYVTSRVREHEISGTKKPTRHAIYGRLRRASKRILGYHIFPHQLRRSRATHLYDKTGDIHVVQAVLGHASPVITFRYILYSDKKIETDYRKYFQRN